MPQATPANWPNNHESIGAKGWAFILPTVTKEDADKVRLLLPYIGLMPGHKTCIPSCASSLPHGSWVLNSCKGLHHMSLCVLINTVCTG